MASTDRERLGAIRRFDQLVAYLRDELDWPIESDDFEDLTFNYSPEELGIDRKNAAKIAEIKRLRPLVPDQPWGIFFVKFEPKRLPVVALRRILGRVTLRKRASANAAERQAWAADDLLFVSNYGEGNERRIAIAHFSTPAGGRDLPTLKVLGWDNRDTPLHLDAVAHDLREHLTWPGHEADVDGWREQWRAAFTLGHGEVIRTSKQLAVRLAELARAIRDRIRTALVIESESGPLTKLMKAFRTALIHDLDETRFADMYAQTIAYGLLSARITDPKRRTADDLAAHMRTNPFLKELMEAFVQVGGRRRGAGGAGIDFDELGVSEIVELLDLAKMEAVVRDFGDRNPQEDPVIHFYEHFLAAYDREKKVGRGVFYTPRPVVSYIVRSVDELLRSEFGLAYGLADTTTWGEMAERHKELKIPEGTPPGQAFVQILDPATGTGTFLIEVIDLVHKTMRDVWTTQGYGEQEIRSLWNDYVPRDLLPRLHGYELLMAPYAIAHLKVSLKLYETGYRFESEARARVYLTNALEPALPLKDVADLFRALGRESREVNEIKRDQRFTVVIGNPPYAGHSRNNQVPWIVDKVYDYKRGYADLKKRGKAKWLQDDYVKFLRLGEWEIARSTAGVLGFITNHKWLDNPTFKGMRKHLLESFDQRTVLDLHGNANNKEIAPDGSPDQNVFEIKQGVAISVLASCPTPAFNEQSVIARSDLLGTDTFKCDCLLANTASSMVSETFRALSPEYIFERRDEKRKAEYERFSSVPSIFSRNGDPAPGIVTTHDSFAISFTPEEEIDKVESLLATQDETEARELFRLCSQSQWDYGRAKEELGSRKWRDEIVPILYRPFDVRFTVYDRHVAVHRRERVSRHFLASRNIGLSIPRACEIRRGWEHTFCTRLMMQHHTVSLKEVNYLLPLWLMDGWPDTHTPNIDAGVAAGVTDETGFAYCERPETRCTNWDGRGGLRTRYGPQDLFDWVYAVLHSELYRNRYATFLKSDFARVPLPVSMGLFRELAGFGKQLVELHLLESTNQADFITTYMGPGNPEIGRVGWSGGTVWLDAAKTNAREGHRASRPGTMGVCGVPEKVWDFHIGGYQVCHKWLKDRKGRTLSDDDIGHYHKIVLALNETVRIMAEIDEVIEAHGGWPVAFEAVGKMDTAPTAIAEGGSFLPRIVEPVFEDRYVTCVPLVPLKAAAGSFSNPQHVEDGDFDWVTIESGHRLRRGMFVAQVVGRSMEPAICDGAWCLFRAPVAGTRQGKTVLVQLRDATDPETGQRYTVKRYRSEKAKASGSWHHNRITLEPANPDFPPIEFTGADGGELLVIAELVEVLKG